MTGGRWAGGARGVWLALTTPVWLRARRIRRLMVEDPRVRASVGSPEPMVRAARVTLARLARIPFSPWRNTCLYRSIAVCRCLRAAGIPALLRIGVRGDDGDAGARDCITAHAWVESRGGAAAGLLDTERDGAFAPLVSPSRERR